MFAFQNNGFLLASTIYIDGYFIFCCFVFLNLSSTAMEESISLSSQDNYNIIKEDPIQLAQLINKQAIVQLIKNTKFNGFLTSIDPLSHSIILAVPEENGFRKVLIPGHAITGVTIIKTDTQPPLPKRSEVIKENLTAKRCQLISWFKLNMLPVTEEGDHILFGNVTIIPPYDVTDICTDNPIVAMQIKKVIEGMPIDFKPK